MLYAARCADVSAPVERLASLKAKVFTDRPNFDFRRFNVPSYRTKRRWSDRVVISDTPLFPGYVFCRFDPTLKLPVLTSSGVVGIVGFGSEPSPIPDDEIEAVKAVLRSGLATEPCPFLHVGQRVRVMYGALYGVEGILQKKKSDFRVVISVPALERSISVEIDREWIKPL